MTQWLLINAWLIALGWQSNNVYRAGRKAWETWRRYREIHSASDTR